MNNASQIVNQVAKIALLPVIGTSLVLGFLWLPPALGFPNEALARIVVFHVPCSIVGSLATAVGVWYAVQFLRKRTLADDSKSSASFALATLLWLLTTVTGALFAKAEWGAYWSWDIKQVCIVMLLLIYLAYFALRAAIDDRRRRAAVSAAYTLFALVAVPFLTLVLPNSTPSSLHPKQASFSPEYRLVLWMFTLGLTLMYLWAFRLHVELETLERRLESRARQAQGAAPTVHLRWRSALDE